MISRTHLAFVVVALVVFLGLFFGSRITTKNVDSQERRDVEKLFMDSTPQSAYAAFVKMNADATEQQQHLAAHLFGDVLYAREGMNGFPVCGPESGFGCYHGFIGAVISERGIQAVGELDAACIRGHGKLGLGCFHGIGHGLVSYYGYGVEDLSKALSMCGTLSWKGTYGGCSDGAFMEYNLRTMQSDTGGIPRAFSAQMPDEPCGLVESKFRISCQFNQGEWWRQTFMGEVDASERIGGLCALIGDREERAACFRGVGYAYAVKFDFDPTKGATFCNQYAGISTGGKLWCREGNAWALYANNVRDAAVSVCTQGLTKTESERCLKEYLFVIN